MIVTKVEVSKGKQVTIQGYVNAVCRDSKVITLPNGGKFVERVEQGVFSKAIEQATNIELKINHDRIIGDTNSGVLELKEDSIGLYAVARIIDSEVVQAAEAGKITGWSFGFVKTADEWEELPEGIHRRILKEIELNEVSLLIGETPVYDAMSYEVRNDSILEKRSYRSYKTDVAINFIKTDENKRLKLALLKFK